jgi:2-polyprenyl-3-methyl-5-hydroxy-6-metoxy-1,4-benzoquinol methylase
MTVAKAFSGIRRVKHRWGKEAETSEAGLHWTEHPAVQRRINTKVSGSAAVDPYQHLVGFLNRNGAVLPLQRCLTLGCGGGELERGLAKYDFCLRHDAYDVADRAIEQARRAAEKHGLTHVNYQTADVNRLSLPPRTYDVVFNVMSAHHFWNLEHVFQQVRNSLKPDGVFFLNEFIGPTKFQWTDRQLEIVNGLLRVLPPKYRMTSGKWLKTKVRRPTLFWMEFSDPSEAVRSGQIVGSLSEHFTIVEKKDYGGTLLHLLLQRIAHNFDCVAANDGKLLQMMFDIEDQLLEAGDIASDFSVIIARPRADSTCPRIS